MSVWMPDSKYMEAMQAISEESVRLAAEEAAQEEAKYIELHQKILEPIVAPLKAQIEELKRENEFREKEAEEAQREAKKATIFSWVTFVITSLISVAALIVSIVK